MLSKLRLNNKYFLNSQWIQFIIKYNVFDYDKILIDLSKILELMRQNKTIKSWFFLNKKNNILIKVEFIKKYRHELLIIYKLKQKYRKITIRTDVFEPEIYQFGGKNGWNISKWYFNKISRLIPKNNESGGDRIRLAIIIVFDLLSRSTGDSFEAWDILQKLMIIRGINPTFQLKYIIKSKFYNDVSLLFNDPKKFYFQNLTEKKIVFEVLKINLLLMRKIEKEKFSLMFPIRSILPYYIIYIFNMFLISGSEQREIIKLLSIFLNSGKYE